MNCGTFTQWNPTHCEKDKLLMYIMLWGQSLNLHERNQAQKSTNCLIPHLQSSRNSQNGACLWGLD